MRKELLIYPLLLILVVFSNTTFGMHKNIMVFNSDLDPSEPSICIDPKNPNNIVAGSILNWYAISSDTGRTWSVNRLQSTYGVWGDPTIGVDSSSNFYYFHLSGVSGFPNWLDRIVCQKLENGKNSWDNGSFTSVNGKEHDKQWLAVDRKKNILYITWSEFDKYGSSDPKDSSRINFSKSTDNGNTWTPIKVLSDKGGDCIDDDNTLEGAVPAVGINGEVYVIWSSSEGLLFEKSTDEGKTWLPNDKIISSQPGGWSYNIPGIFRCNGLPIIECDRSDGKDKGNIYVNWSDQRNGSNDTDVWLIKSSDNGNTWSQIVRVNDDLPGKHQFFTWMTVDQITGYIYCIFYDRRNHNDEGTDVYLAVSKDGGTTFINKKISETPFYPNDQVFFGDYNNISAYNNIIRPIWTSMTNGNTTVWTALIEIDSLLMGVENEFSDALKSEEIELYQNYPNPFRHITYIPFKLKQPTYLTLEVYDSRGSLINQIINRNYYSEGRHSIAVDAVNLNLQQGVYFYMLRSERQILAQKMIIIK